MELVSLGVMELAASFPSHDVAQRISMYAKSQTQPEVKLVTDLMQRGAKR